MGSDENSLLGLGHVALAAAARERRHAADEGGGDLAFEAHAAERPAGVGVLSRSDTDSFEKLLPPFSLASDALPLTMLVTRLRCKLAQDLSLDSMHIDDAQEVGSANGQYDLVVHT